MLGFLNIESLVEKYLIALLRKKAKTMNIPEKEIRIVLRLNHKNSVDIIPLDKTTNKYHAPMTSREVKNILTND